MLLYSFMEWTEQAGIYTVQYVIKQHLWVYKYQNGCLGNDHSKLWIILTDIQFTLCKVCKYQNGCLGNNKVGYEYTYWHYHGGDLIWQFHKYWWNLYWARVNEQVRMNKMEDTVISINWAIYTLRYCALCHVTIMWWSCD